MRRTLLALYFLLLSISFLAAQTNPNHVYVDGYYKSNGTYVEGYYRTAPNSTNTDNFSTKGNVNPYTGKAGWIEPDNNYYSSGSNNYSSGTTYNYSNSSTPKYTGTTNYAGQKVLEYSNGKEIFSLCKYCSVSTYDDNLDYYWYSAYSGIQSTKGGSGGTLLEGEYKFYNEDGALAIKANYITGLKHGDYMSWADDGSIKEKAHFSYGIPDYMKFKNDEGYWIEFNGVPFKDNTVRKTYTSNNVLIVEEKQLSGLKHYVKTYFESTGRLQNEYYEIFPYDNKSGVGNFVGYYDNGNVQVKGQFYEGDIGGIRNGTWTWYFKDGTFDATEEYKVETLKWYGGEIKAIGSYIKVTNKTYKNGIFEKTVTWDKVGYWREYDYNGKLISTKEYKGGVEVTK